MTAHLDWRTHADPVERDATGSDTRLLLSVDEREVVAMVVRAYAAALTGEAAARLGALASFAAAGTVPGGGLADLERVLRLALETGKGRELGRAEAERVLIAVLRRMPAGRELAAALERVNEALSSLSGRTLQSVRAGMRVPGRYTLTLEVEGASLTLALGSHGLTVESLTAG